MRDGSPSHAAPWTQGELTWLGCALLLALILRAWGWAQIGIDHFDEGVYAFTALAWSDLGQGIGSYPDQILFSPPVFPFLASLFFRVLGPEPTTIVGLNVLLGLSTVAAVAWIGGRWFGARAGLAAGILLAVDPLHVMLSRSALTDVAFLLFFVLALGAASEAFSRQSVRWAIGAGLLTGIAWNTKYHGWFVLLVAGWGLLHCLWVARGGRSALLRLGLLWCTMAAVAALCYLPWALHIQSEIGYRAMLAYQDSNVSGTWGANLVRQAGQQIFIETPWSRLGPGLAAFALITTGARESRAGRVALLGGVTATGLVLGQGATVLLMLVIALLTGAGRGLVPFWLLAGWTALWLASAPLYDPYARLLLPLWAAAALGAGLLLSRWAVDQGWPEEVVGDRSGPSSTRSGWSFNTLSVGSLLILVAASSLAYVTGRDDPKGVWRPSDRVEVAAARLTDSIPPGERVVVVGEPELAYYLHLSGRPAFERTETPQEIAAIGDTVFFAVGRYARRVDFLRTNILEALASRLRRVDSVAVVPRDLTILDDLTPSRAARYLERPDGEFDAVLYRLLPEN